MPTGGSYNSFAALSPEKDSSGGSRSAGGPSKTQKRKDGLVGWPALPAASTSPSQGEGSSKWSDVVSKGLPPASFSSPSVPARSLEPDPTASSPPRVITIGGRIDPPKNPATIPWVGSPVQSWGPNPSATPRGWDYKKDYDNPMRPRSPHTTTAQSSGSSAPPSGGQPSGSKGSGKSEAWGHGSPRG